MSDDPAWMQRGNCLGLDESLFFPTQGESVEPAKAVCNGCVVRDTCLRHALDNCERWGIWGGTTERERRRMRRRERLARRAS